MFKEWHTWHICSSISSPTFMHFRPTSIYNYFESHRGITTSPFPSFFSRKKNLAKMRAKLSKDTHFQARISSKNSAISESWKGLTLIWNYSKINMKCWDGFGRDLALVNSSIFSLNVADVQLVLIGARPMHNVVSVITSILELTHRQNVQVFMSNPSHLQML